MEYYFTFGQSHKTKSGIPMKDYWVRVVVEPIPVSGWSAIHAENLFESLFTSRYMINKKSWSKCYCPEHNKIIEPVWIGDAYPKGQFAVIENGELWVKPQWS